MFRTNSLSSFRRCSVARTPGYKTARKCCTVIGSSAVKSGVQVTFRIKRQLEFGQSHKIVGAGKLFGNWNVEKAPEMQWQDGHVWELQMEIPSGTELEFKCVQDGNGETKWENGDNRQVLFQDDWGSTTINLDWDKTNNFQAEFSAHPQNQNQNGVSNPNLSSSDSDSNNVSESDEESFSDEEMGQDMSFPKTEWVGKDIEFMDNNNHSRDRHGARWDISAVEGWKEGLDIVKGDEKSANWLKKLQIAKEILVDQAENKRPNIDELTAAYIYLTWIGTGAIQCVEGGGHYRPNKHAELSRMIFRSLEWVIGENCDNNQSSVSYRKSGVGQSLENPQWKGMLARAMQTKLPSFDAQFTASTPLTRIRDIAHRSDIPHDLKRQIKHTIQNKLHRNAGPEDLQATEILLAQLLKEKEQYSDGFISEFKLFARELRDFFNAGSLTQLLEDIRPSLEDDKDTILLLDTFLVQNSQLNSTTSNENALNDTIDVLHRLTTVRAILIAGLSAGLRNDASDQALSMRQKWRLAEIRCQDYAFVLLSQIINLLNEKSLQKKGSDVAWALPLGALVLGVRQLGLGGWEVQECMAIGNELEAWQSQGAVSTDRQCSLRLKATLQRLKRLQDKWSEMILELFSENSQKLGRGLGVDSEIYDIFSESEIRAHIIFQISKISGILLKAINVITESSPWDGLVLGEASGKLTEVDSLDPDALPKEEKNNNLIVLVKRADGDEEISALGGNVKGVLLCQSLPHLSHLGVRARQEKVPFSCCEDEESIQSMVLPLLNKNISMHVDQNGLQIYENSNPSPETKQDQEENEVIDEVVVSQPKFVSSGLIAGLEATTETCGAKAASVAQLAQISDQVENSKLFLTLSSAVIPFGGMEEAIKQANKEKEWKKLLEQAETASNSDVEETGRQLRELVSGLSVGKKYLDALQKVFKSEDRLIVRSSANVEDLKGLSGAGLYDSIGGVYLKDPQEFCSAVAKVWASLYTRRAILSRRAADVPQSNASMAILVQKMVEPEYCFVLHTKDPQNPQNNIAMELAPGLGETLASGTRGSGYRMSVNYSTNEVEINSFANFSTARVQGGGTNRIVDYSREQFTLDQKFRENIGQKLCKVGKQLEAEFGCAQDVEGAVVGEEIYVVQSRPQP